MRPVRRGPSPREEDYENYRDAFVPLADRLGLYCSFCERRIPTNLAVEHIQPKDEERYPELAGRWGNFLLGCVNCNSTKGDKDVQLAEVLLPDRDNTFAAFEYDQGGRVQPAASLNDTTQAHATRTLSLVGLNVRISQAPDPNGKLVAIDRVTQRMEAWLTALEAKSDIESNPGNEAVVRGAARTARESGFFSIWMAAFEGDTKTRNLLIDAFPGTRESGCFDPMTAAPVFPALNPDGLANGGKA